MSNVLRTFFFGGGKAVDQSTNRVDCRMHCNELTQQNSFSVAYLVVYDAAVSFCSVFHSMHLKTAKNGVGGYVSRYTK